jgi:hypothetical protein
MPSNKSYDKIVTQTIHRIDKLDSDDQIEAFLKDQGLNADERLVILDLVETEMGKDNRSQDEFFHDESRDSKPKDLDAANELSIHDEISSFTSGTQKNVKQNVDHKYISSFALLANSLSSFFGNIHKYLFLFIIFLSTALIIEQLSNLVDNPLIITSLDVLIVFLVMIYFISLAKFIGNGSDEYLFSIKYAFLNFIPIFFTIILIAIVVVSMNSIAELLRIFGDNIFIKTLQITVEALSILVVIWYSLTFFIMINEEEFYVDAISKSRKYIKSHFPAYIVRLAAFLVPYLLIAGAFVWALSMMGAFSFELFLQDQDLHAAISDDIKIEAIFVVFLAIFFLSSWLGVFLQKFYQEFAMKENFAAGKLSTRHQNMFFILLTMAPLLIGGSSIVGLFGQGNGDVNDGLDNTGYDYSDNITESNIEDNNEEGDFSIENTLDSQLESEINNQ